MNKTIHLTLLAGLMLTSMTAIDAAPARSKPFSFAKASADKSRQAAKKSGFSLKTKAIAAVSVVATVAIPYLAYRYKTGKSEVTLDDILRYEPQTVPAYKVPAGQAGRLMRNLEAHSANFRHAMQNPVCRANIEACFNNEEFMQFMNGRLGEQLSVQLNAIFDYERIHEISAWDDFTERTLQRMRVIEQNIRM